MYIFRKSKHLKILKSLPGGLGLISAPPQGPMGAQGEPMGPMGPPMGPLVGGVLLLGADLSYVFFIDFF